jgi:hypothetical protein
MYSISWNQALFPDISHLSEPAQYPAAPKREDPKPFTEEAFADFFVEFAQNDVLGLLGKYHLLAADPNGMKDPLVLKLAEEFSKAVDYGKSGLPGTVPEEAHEKLKFCLDYMEEVFSFGRNVFV